MGSAYANFDVMWTDMKACLKAFGIRQVGTLQGSMVIEYQADVGDPADGGTCKMWNRDLWTVCDNGGELNVERINHADTLRSVPYTNFDVTLDGATMAYRVRRVLDGDEIDYSLRLKDMLDDLRAA